MNPGRLAFIKAFHAEWNPRSRTVSGAQPSILYERFWSHCRELLDELNNCHQTLGQIASTPTLDMTPAQQAVIMGIKEMARRRLNGE